MTAAVARAGFAVLPGELALGALHLAALCWSVAFLAFVALYAGVLARPRVDGAPG